MFGGVYTLSQWCTTNLLCKNQRTVRGSTIHGLYGIDRWLIMLGIPVYQPLDQNGKAIQPSLNDFSLTYVSLGSQLLGFHIWWKCVFF